MKKSRMYLLIEVHTLTPVFVFAFNELVNLSSRLAQQLKQTKGLLKIHNYAVLVI